jgi:hypothetical protein
LSKPSKLVDRQPAQWDHHDSHINLLAKGERMPVYVHVIDHPDARVLVDTGMTELHPAVADLDPASVP